MASRQPVSKRAIVTGASGFIASHLVKRLLHDGWKVGATVRYNTPHRNVRIADVWDKLDIIEADFRNRGDAERVGHWGCDVYFHTAAYNHVGQSFDKSEECMMSNVIGTVNALDNCDSPVYGEPIFVYVSTSEVYGRQDMVPWNEDMVPRPSSPYAVSKLSGEQYCLLRQRQGWNIRVVRPFNTYGPWQSEKAVIPAIIKRCLKGEKIENNAGEQTREFNYVDDIVDGIIKASQVKFDGPLNLGCGVDRPIRSVINDINHACGLKSEITWDKPYRPNEIMEMCSDPDRARRLLSWEPKTLWEDGILNTVSWFKASDYQWGSF